jgi:hypothetical protein
MTKKWFRVIACFVANKQTDAFVKNHVNGILKEFSPDLEQDDDDVIQRIVDVFDEIQADNERCKELAEQLTNNNFRAKWCLKNGVKNIFKGLVRRISTNTLNRFGELFERFWDKLAAEPWTRHLKNVHIAGDRYLGKSSVYQLAIFICEFGYPPNVEIIIGPNHFTTELLAQVKPEWTDDCINEPEDDTKCEFARVRECVCFFFIQVFINFLIMVMQ